MKISEFIKLLENEIESGGDVVVLISRNFWLDDEITDELVELEPFHIVSGQAWIGLDGKDD